jgi:23S rRNA pseudouridine1911/1915/1917 synthase
VTESTDYRDGLAAEDFEAAVERRQWQVNAAQHGQRVDRLLAQAAPEFSRNHLQSLMEQGHVQLDGQVCTQCSRRAKAGQQIAVDLVPTAQALAFKPEALLLPIVFEDEHLLVINKPAGLVVHPGAGNWSGTLLNGLLAHHAQAAGLPRAGIVHRLDKGTTGLMVVGKSLHSVTELVRAIAAREVKREYAALVHGELMPQERSFEGPIGRDPGSRLRMAVVASGKPARTDVKRLFTGLGASAVRCRLHTGRTHQIRVHLSQAGYPLLSDTVYGGRSALGLDRPALHAWRLSFAHPIEGRPMAFEAPFPPDFAAAWAAVEAG